MLPAKPTLTRAVVCIPRPCTKTSALPQLSPATMLLASDWKATKRPSAEMDGCSLRSSLLAPAESTLTRVVAGESA